MAKKILIVIVIIILALQLYRPDIEVPSTHVQGQDILSQYPDAPPTLKAACYDCHSYESKLPWYAYINPMGILVRNHIRDARKKLNFSLFQTYDLEKRQHKLEECVEEVEKGNMPIKNYSWMHPESRLTTDQRNELTAWFKTIAALQQ